MCRFELSSPSFIERSLVRTVVFVFDYVMHYHQAMLKAVEAHLRQKGDRFVLLTARHSAGTTGRTPLTTKVVEHQHAYHLREKQIRGFTLRHQGGLIRELHRLRPDVVVTMCHSGTVSEWLTIAKKRHLGFRLVAWQCGYEYNPGRIKNTVLSAFIPHFDHHLAYHTNAKRYAMTYGATERQVTVMHNTINEALIQCLPRDQARDIICERFPELRERCIVLYVGAVLEEKRLEVVIEALDLLRNPDLAFVVVGDGPHLDKLRALTEGRSDVFLAGRIVEGVGPWFDAADMFVLPGTGGLALNEAMAHSLPLISGYADGSADDLVQDGVNGYRLESSSTQELATCIGKLAGDVDLRKRMGAESREMITSRLSFRNFIDRVTHVLDTI